MHRGVAAWTWALQGDLYLVLLREVGPVRLLLLLVMVMVVRHARVGGGADGKENMGGLLLGLDLVLGWGLMLDLMLG